MWFFLDYINNYFQITMEPEEYLKQQKNFNVLVVLASQVSKICEIHGIYFFKQFRKSQYRRKGTLFSTTNENQPILLLEVDQWPNYTKLRVNTDPLGFLQTESNRGMTLWKYLANQLGGTSEDFKKIISILGIRLSLNDERMFYKQFKMGINIELWRRNAHECSKIASIYRTKYQKALCLKQFVQSDDEAKEKWEFENGDFTKSHILSSDIFDEITEKEIFWCPNFNCQKRFSVKSQIDAHKISCPLKLPISTTTYKQIQMSYQTEEEKLLKDLGFQFHLRHFASFDIECVTQKDVGQAKLNQSLISISVCPSWSPANPKCFLRKNSSTSSASILIKTFLSHVHQLHQDYESQYCNDIKAMESHLNDMEPHFNDENFSNKYLYRQTLTYLQNLKKLTILGWNSERYDFPQIFAFLVAYFGCSDENISVIRRGSGIFTIINFNLYIQIGIMRFSTPNLVFTDGVNYTTKMSLATFAKVYCNGLDISKGVFPHSFFESIEQIRNQVEFPAYSKFKSSISRPLEKEIEKFQSEFEELNDIDKSKIDQKENLFMSPLVYISSRDDYLSKLESGEWSNFSCYLKFYNNRDTEVLTVGYSNFISTCILEYNISPLQCISLAHMSSKLAWKAYDPMAYGCFSFSDKFAHLNVDLRSSLCGGYTGIGIRHIKTNTPKTEEPDLAPEVTTSDCGLPYKTIQGYDANSLYSFPMQQEMPCGPGTLLRLNSDNLFEGQFMGNRSNGLSQFSFVKGLIFFFNHRLAVY